MEGRELSYRLESKYERNRVNFRRPTRLGSYAVNKSLTGKTMLDSPEDFYPRYTLKQFKKTKKLDLKDGFEERPDDRIMSSDVHPITELLRWIINNKKLFVLQSEKLADDKLNSLNTDFVAFRGVFTLLLNISYDFRNQFALHVEKFKGTHYLMLQKFDDDVQLPLFCFAGRRFELYCIEPFDEADKLKLNPLRKKKDERTGGDSNDDDKNKFTRHSTNELCFVYRSRLNHNSLVYGAEMDCFENVVHLHEPIDSDKIEGVELKTCKAVQNDRQRQTFEKFKTLKWHNQSFLSNVKKVAVGFWQGDHIVDRIEEYSLKDLVRMGGNTWSPELCLFQCDKILAFIKSCFLTKEHEGKSLLKFTYRSFSYKLVCDDIEVQPVLPDFYKNEFN